MDDKAVPGRHIPDRDEAIATLFYACYPKLVRTGYSLAGDWAVAEEIAQEAFTRLWHRWRWIRDPETAPSYLYRTVVNLSNSAIRRRALERRVAGLRGEQPAGHGEHGVVGRQQIWVGPNAEVVIDRMRGQRMFSKNPGS